MRSIVSYDDMIGPEEGETEPGPPTNLPPPSKKRRTNQKSKRRAIQHWDDPGAQALPMPYDDNTASAAMEITEEYVEEEEESRELDHEEIWDDSALIDAWNSATAEYEAFHGLEKKWKDEPLKKSALWHNVPPSPSKSKGKEKAVDGNYTTNTTASVSNSARLSAIVPDDEPQIVEGDSVPIIFDSYVPTHDPSLGSIAPPHPPALPGPEYAAHYLPNPPGPTVSQDDAFNRAVAAMYWAGYWTAMYHSQSQKSREHNTGEGGAAKTPNEAESEGDANDEEDMLPAQR